MKRDPGALTGRVHDLVVVGGGICGAAAAWDAAQRGLQVALVEARDFGSGASWNSLKTIHGGLRHLQRGDLPSLLDSSRERSALLRIAPELVKPLGFLVPTYGHGAAGREALAAGLLLNNLLTSGRNAGLPQDRHVPAGRILSRRDVLDLVPGVEARGLTGGALWYDAQVESSERLTLAFVLAAAEAGAAVANHLEVTGLLLAGNAVGGVRGRDRESGDTLEIRARAVLNAAGPGADRIAAMAGVAAPRVPLLRAINLVLRRPVGGPHAVGGRVEGRFLFLVPWRDRAVVGTAYEASEAPSRAAFVEGFLSDARRAFPWAELAEEDVALVHQGQVPGHRDAAGLWSRSLLVDHERVDGVRGIVTAVAVKYTTARSLAQKAVDLVTQRLGRPPAPCRTAVTPLPARILMGPIEDRTRHAVGNEMAIHLEDAVLRRLDLGTAGPPPGDELETVVRTMASDLGWTPERIDEEKSFLHTWYGLAGRQPGL